MSLGPILVTNSWRSLPDELVHKIIPNLSLLDIGRFMSTCQQFFAFSSNFESSSNNKLWEDIANTHTVFYLDPSIPCKTQIQSQLQKLNRVFFVN